MVAVRPVYTQCVKEVLCYQVPSSTEWTGAVPHHIFIPNVFEEISMYYNKKEEAIKAYETEIREYPHPRCPEVVRCYDDALAKKNGLVLAEGFLLIRKVNR